MGCFALISSFLFHLYIILFQKASFPLCMCPFIYWRVKPGACAPCLSVPCRTLSSSWKCGCSWCSLCRTCCSGGVSQALLPRTKEVQDDTSKLSTLCISSKLFLSMSVQQLILCLWSWLSLWLSWQRIFLQWGRPGLDPWVGKIPWRRERLPSSGILAWRIPWTI